MQSSTVDQICLSPSSSRLLLWPLLSILDQIKTQIIQLCPAVILPAWPEHSEHYIHYLTDIASRSFDVSSCF